jgi:acyl dehydratase
MGEVLWLDDLSPGMSFTHGPLEVTAEEIKSFAARFDPQPFHLDEAAGEASFFQGLAASGWHTAALTMRLLVTGGPRLAGGYIGAGGEVSWARPVYAGDSLTIHAEITEVKPSRSKPDRGFILLRCETRNQHGQPVQNLSARLMVPRRGAA